MTTDKYLSLSIFLNSASISTVGVARTSDLGKKFEIFPLMQCNSAIKGNRSPTLSIGNTMGSAHSST